MLKEEFGKLVEEALNELPETILKNMENANIDIMEEPLPRERGEEKLEDNGKKKIELRTNGILLGLYKGTPRIKWGKGYGNITTEEIIIFQKNVEKFEERGNKILEVLRENIFYEIVRNYGFDEEKIRTLKENQIKRRL